MRPARPISAARAEVRRQSDDRVRQRLGLAGRHEVAGDAVLDELAEAADLCGDHRPRTFHRLQRDHPEALAHRRHDDDRRLLDRPLDRRDVAEEPHRVFDLELFGQRAQRRLERAASRNVEPQGRHLPPRLRKRAQQDDVALDRDQTSDAEEPRLARAVRPRLAVGLDAVVDDLEARSRRSPRPPRGSARGRARSRCDGAPGSRSRCRRVRSCGSRGTR